MTPYDRDQGRCRGRDNVMSLFDNFDRKLWRPFESWDPLEHFNAIWDEGPMRSLVKEARAAAGTKVDWKETPDAHVFKADLPGLSKEEVKVTVEDGKMLRISGERTREKEEKTDTWHRVERSQGSFLRQFTLPESSNIDEMHAKVENGVLTVTVPKLQSSERPRHRTIDIK